MTPGFGSSRHEIRLVFTLACLQSRIEPLVCLDCRICKPRTDVSSVNEVSLTRVASSGMAFGARWTSLKRLIIHIVGEGTDELKIPARRSGSQGLKDIIGVHVARTYILLAEGGGPSASASLRIVSRKGHIMGPDRSSYANVISS